jgi:hypothetical protein
MNEAVPPRFLRRADAAKYVRERWGVPCAARTLAKIACISSDGPEMHYAGRIPLYTTESLDAWALKKIGPPRRSTSDHNESVSLPEALLAPRAEPGRMLSAAGCGPKQAPRARRGPIGGKATPASDTS